MNGFVVSAIVASLWIMSMDVLGYGVLGASQENCSCDNRNLVYDPGIIYHPSIRLWSICLILSPLLRNILCNFIRLFIIIWAVLILGTKLEAVLVKFGSENSGGSRIFPRGGVNLQGGREHAKFSRKLHEIERIWTPRGGRASLTPPLDPPMEKIETFMFIYLHQAHSLFNNSTENPYMYDTFNLRTYPSEEKRIIELFWRNICSADLTKEVDCLKIFVHIIL